MLYKQEGELDVDFWVKRLGFILMHPEAVTVGKTGNRERRGPHKFKSSGHRMLTSCFSWPRKQIGGGEEKGENGQVSELLI
jgi:hypothetical protein